MSLLIDALRKAEQDRAQAQDGSAAPRIDELSLAPIEPPSRASPPPPPPLAADADREAAANLFAVKHAANARTRLGWIGGLGLLAALCIVAYVWWQWPAPRPATAPRVAQAPLPLPDPSPAPQPPPAELMAAAPPATPAPRPSAATSPPPAQRGALGQVTPPPAPPAADPASTPQFRRTQAPPPTVAANLSAGYRAYAVGDLATARRHYQAHLQHDPNSVDALNGLGAIALHEGQLDQAAQWFRRTLAAAPHNASAIAGLSATGLAPADDREAGLRHTLAEQPASAIAAFSLGNVLAEQGRWAEAQQAYFQAHTLTPDNPDYLFNLAVSLDQLGQRRLARDYYSQALAAARDRPAVFDPEPVLARRNALTEALQ